ncbi:GIY-YIG nuclease family protein [Brevibacterium linens]|uniref:GIY-YIG nuclease family protein n=1 Tax=Brevibacterium linens TaxID=1703 RepID=UPI0013791312|nr:GIY-YIG nuclease family protein [Brevibacterium linens]
MSTRLKEHAKKKDWWDKVAVITSQAESSQLTKSQVRYLESRLIQKAKEASRAQLDNVTDPGFELISEAERSNMSAFLNELYSLLPTMGIDIFRGSAPSEQNTNSDGKGSTESPEFFLSVARQNITANASLVDGEFVVMAGSISAGGVARSDSHAQSTAKVYEKYQRLFEELLSEGVLETNGESTRFAKNAPFGSPSTAAFIVTGRACNGRKEWKTKDGVSFGDWEARGVEP